MLKGIKHSITECLSPTGRHLAALRGDFRSRCGRFKNDRSAAQQQALTVNFVRVLTAWGIDDVSEIPGVIRILRLRSLVFVLPVLVCAVTAAIFQTFIACLTLLLVAAPCLLGLLTNSWRISILKKRRFLPFLRWLVSAGWGGRPEGRRSRVR